MSLGFFDLMLALNRQIQLSEMEAESVGCGPLTVVVSIDYGLWTNNSITNKSIT
jgi:hypothetical protein